MLRMFWQYVNNEIKKMDWLYLIFIVGGVLCLIGGLLVALGGA